MRRKPLDRMDCSIAKALDIVGDPWTMLILRDALLGVRRFETFSTRLGIPRATLSARLDHCANAACSNSGGTRNGRSGSSTC